GPERPTVRPCHVPVRPPPAAGYTNNDALPEEGAVPVPGPEAHGSMQQTVERFTTRRFKSPARKIRSDSPSRGMVGACVNLSLAVLLPRKHVIERVADEPEVLEAGEVVGPLEDRVPDVHV